MARWLHWLLFLLLAVAPQALAPLAARAITAVDAAAATATRSATATPTGASNGSECTTPSQCATGFCSDDVCCDRACDGPTESCSQPGARGTCVSLQAPAPPLSRKGLLSVIALLTAAGLLLFSRRRRLSAAATHGAQ